MRNHPNNLKYSVHKRIGIRTPSNYEMKRTFYETEKLSNCYKLVSEAIF